MPLLVVEVKIQPGEDPCSLDGTLDAIAGESEGSGFHFRTRIRDRIYEFKSKRNAEQIAATIRDRLKELGRERGSKVVVKR